MIDKLRSSAALGAQRLPSRVRGVWVKPREAAALYRRNCAATGNAEAAVALDLMYLNWPSHSHHGDLYGRFPQENWLMPGSVDTISTNYGILQCLQLDLSWRSHVSGLLMRRSMAVGDNALRGSDPSQKHADALAQMGRPVPRTKRSSHYLAWETLDAML